MTKPDLDTEEGRLAYRAELRAVALPWRLGGLGLIIVGSILALGSTRGWLGLTEGVATTAGYGLLACGWVLFIIATFLRTRHHRRRLTQDDL